MRNYLVKKLREKMTRNLNLVLIALLLVSGCATVNPPNQVAEKSSRVFNRDLTSASPDTTKVRVINSQLVQGANQATNNLQANSAKPAVPKAAPVPTSRFKFEPTDLSFKQALTRWANIAGWQVSWEAEKDFPGRISAEFPNDFELAVSEATKAYRNSDYPLKSCGYDNKVVRVVRYLGTGTECKLETN